MGDEDEGAVGRAVPVPEPVPPDHDRLLSTPSRTPDAAENVSAKVGKRFMNHAELDRRTLAAWRKARGLTQRQLARLIDAPEQSIAAWEAGRRLPRLENLQKLADALDILVDEIAFPEQRPLPYRQRQKEQRRQQREQREQHSEDDGDD